MPCWALSLSLALSLALALALALQLSSLQLPRAIEVLQRHTCAVMASL